VVWLFPVAAAAGALFAVGARPAESQQPDSVGSIAAILAEVSAPNLPALPVASAFTAGARTIAAGTTVASAVAVHDGAVDVYGTVNGDVVTVRGDIVVHDGGTVNGNAVAIDGELRTEGTGHVTGQVLRLTGAAVVPEPQAPGERVRNQLMLVAGWLTILLVISAGVLVLAPDNLMTVADALERHYGNSLVAGLAGQVAFAPLLLAVCVALVLTVLGILLIPFAIVAYAIVAAGLVTLGLLATAVVIGRGWKPAPAGTDRERRAATLRAVLVGDVVVIAPWLLAALLAAWPVAESVARGVAFAVTWVACTAGLGATLISRAGIRRARSSTATRAMASPGWQTPTPITGVAAARRPAATPTPGPR
jgi:hypothetical protein